PGTPRRSWPGSGPARRSGPPRRWRRRDRRWSGGWSRSGPWRPPCPLIQGGEAPVAREWTLSLAGPRHAVVAQPADHGAAGDAELAGGLGLVAAAAGEHVQDPLALEGLDLAVQGGGLLHGGDLRGRWSRRRRQVLLG